MLGDKILVTGATGFIGRALVRELRRRGHVTRCAVRDKSTATDLAGEIAEVGEVNSSTNWESALGEIGIVIHLVARAHILKETTTDPFAAFCTVNLDGTRVLAEAAAAKGVRRLVYVSSIGVNGSFTADYPFTEKSDAAPYNAYSASKYAAEQALLEVFARTGLDVVIVRPPLVYGPDNPGNFLRLLKLIDRGLPLPFGSIANRRSMIFLGNLVDALITCALRSEAAGKLYLVSDDEVVTTPQLIYELARLMDRPTRMWPLPISVLRMAARSVGRIEEAERLIGSLVIDGGKIRRELGWSPPYTLHAGLAETVRWFQEMTRR